MADGIYNDDYRRGGETIMRTFLTVFTAIVCMAGYAAKPEPPLVPYKVTVARGESVWDACARVASDKDHMQELVYNTLKENHIKDPGNVQPGQELIIKVKAAGHVRIDDTSR